jgi:hypothetical protein
VPGVRAPAAPAAPAGPAGSAGPDATDPPPAADPSPTAEPTADPTAELESARVLRVALGVAWAIAVLATLIGAGLVWSIASAEDPFGTPRTESELVVRTLAQFAAPSLLSTGLLAIVALVVVDGVRRARRLGRSQVGDDGGAP